MLTVYPSADGQDGAHLWGTNQKAENEEAE